MEIKELIGIKFWVLSDDTVAYSVEYRRIKPSTWVQIIASVRFIYFFRFVLSSLLPLRSVGRSNFHNSLHIGVEGHLNYV